MRRFRTIRKYVFTLLVLFGFSYLAVEFYEILLWDTPQRDLAVTEANGMIVTTEEDEGEYSQNGSILTQPYIIHLATVACGERVEEGMVMIKSAAILTKSHLMLHIFTESPNHHKFSEWLESWPGEVRERIQYRLYNITSPGVDPDAKGWVNPPWRPCSNHRLFLPSFLPEVDAVIYLDSDTLLLSPVEEVWSVFGQFDDQQMIAAAPETQSKWGGWYKHNAKTPYVPPAGLNSGVLLMNLTRMRHHRWTKGIVQHSITYRRKLILPDQDLVNIYLHFRPEKLHQLDCSWNYRTDHCRGRHRNPSVVCRPAEQHGAFILHGSRRSFKGRSSFQPMYAAFKQQTIGSSLTQTLAEMEEKMKQGRGRSQCSRVTTPYFLRLAKAVTALRQPAKGDLANNTTVSG